MSTEIEEAAAVSADEREKKAKERGREGVSICDQSAARACAHTANEHMNLICEPTIFDLIRREVPLIAVYGGMELRVLIELVERLAQIVQSGGDVCLEHAV